MVKSMSDELRAVEAALDRAYGRLDRAMEEADLEKNDRLRNLLDDINKAADVAFEAINAAERGEF